MRVTTFLLVLTALLAAALAAGQYYVPRAYYTIDDQGHETAPVPLRRLRRSLQPHPTPAPYPGGGGGGSWSNSGSGSSSWSNSGSGSGGWSVPGAGPGGYGSAAPKN